MKRLFGTMFLLLFVVFFSAKAQDTLRIRSVQEGGAIGEISTVIGGDTLPNGQPVNPNRVYLLTRGGRYLTNGGRIQTPNGFHLRLIGEPAPATGTDPGPAVFQPAPNGTGGFDATAWNIYGDITFKNIWFMYWTSNDARPWSPMQWMSDDAHADVDNCIFEWMICPAIEVLGRNMTCRFTNNVFRNGIDPSQWWAGRMIYFVAVPADSVFMENNTIVNCGFGFQQQNNGLDYFWCNHNTFVNIAKFAFLNEQWEEAYITNNVFYNCHFTGERFSDRGGQDPDGFLYGAVLDVDTLRSTVLPPGADSAAAEASKIVVFHNNSNYTESWFQTYYDQYNAVPTHLDPIEPEPIVNERTDLMFNTPAWHKNMKRGNIYDGVDPGFMNVPTNRDSIIAFLDARYLSTGANVDWGWDSDADQFGTNPRNLTTWPIVDNLAYTNSTLLTGGVYGNFPIGDLKWFPAQKATWETQAAQERQAIKGLLVGVDRDEARALPTQYRLEPNYPNPFNPFTTINFSVPQKGNVELVVSNMLGQHVRTLVNGDLSAGTYRAQWDGKDDNSVSVGSGVYFYQLRGGSNFVETKKMILIK
jgi:hypothetical protein